MLHSILPAISCAGPTASQHQFLPSGHQLIPIERSGLGHGFFCLKDLNLCSPIIDRLTVVVIVEVMDSIQSSVRFERNAKSQIWNKALL